MSHHVRIPTKRELKRHQRAAFEAVNASSGTPGADAGTTAPQPGGSQPTWGTNPNGDAPAPATDQAPTAPLNIAAVSTVQSDGRVAIAVTWNEVVLPSGSRVHYEVRWRRPNAPYSETAYQYGRTADGVLSFTIQDGVPNVAYKISVQAINAVSGATSGYSDDLLHTTVADTTPPGVPTGLVVITGQRKVIARIAGNSEFDFDHYEYAVSADNFSTQVTGSPFKSGATIFAWEAPASAMVGGSYPTYYVKVRAVDTSGNASAYTSVASAVLGGTAFDELIAGTIYAAAILAGSFKTATSGKRDEIDGAGVRLYDNSGALVVDLNTTTGAATFKGAISSGSTIDGATITGSLIRTAASGTRIEIDNSSHSQKWYEGSTLIATILATSGAFQINGNDSQALTWDGSTAAFGIKRLSHQAYVTMYSDSSSTLVQLVNKTAVATFRDTGVFEADTIKALVGVNFPSQAMTSGQPNNQYTQGSADFSSPSGVGTGNIQSANNASVATGGASAGTAHTHFYQHTHLGNHFHDISHTHKVPA